MSKEREEKKLKVYNSLKYMVRVLNFEVKASLGKCIHTLAALVVQYIYII
jgi:hypothetical protein